MNDDTDVLVVGTGYLGLKVAQMSRTDGTKVYATTRGINRLGPLCRAGLRPIRFDWTHKPTFGNLPLDQLSANARVLVAVSYDLRSPVSRYESQVGGLRNLLQVLPGDARICYISTTGVYHQSDGRWVDERSPTHPDRLGGRVHLQAEQLLHAMRPQGWWTVLRLAGIYGPGRVPRIADVIQGRPIASAEHGFLNLIHVHDAARAVLASWRNMADWMPADQATADWDAQATAGMQRRLYAVADDRPVRRGDFYAEIASRCGVARPQFIEPPSDAPTRMRSNSNKRVWNRKLRRDLLRTLDFPDYRCGLADLM